MKTMLIFFLLLVLSEGSVDLKLAKHFILDVMKSNSAGWDDGSICPVLVRLAWHASGTWSPEAEIRGGSNGATMRFAPELTDDANKGLQFPRAWMEEVYQRLQDRNSPMSRADIWIYASYVALEVMGLDQITFVSGRVDYSASTSRVPPNGRLPDATLGAEHTRDVFGRMEFTNEEMVALIGGGHTIGRMHADRSGFTGPWSRKPTTMNNAYFQHLVDDEYVEDPKNPGQFVDTRDGKTFMTPNDISLINDEIFAPITKKFAVDEPYFLAVFRGAWKKLTEFGHPQLYKDEL